MNALQMKISINYSILCSFLAIILIKKLTVKEKPKQFPLAGLNCNIFKFNFSNLRILKLNISTHCYDFNNGKHF